MDETKKNFRIKTSHHIVHFAQEHQQVLIDNDVPRISESGRTKGCFSYISKFMYNSADKTILGKTKEKWFFILLGLLVASFFLFSVINLIHRTALATASEFTYTRRNETGEYYVIRRKLDADTTSNNL